MTIKEFLMSNKAKTLYWQFANMAILLLVGLVTDTGYYPAILLPLLNGITKYINQNYLKK